MKSKLLLLLFLILSILLFSIIVNGQHEDEDEEVKKIQSKITSIMDNIKMFGHKRFVEHVEPIKLNTNLWSKKSIAHLSNSKIELTFGIKQSNLDILNEKVRQVSDPNHKDYGKYLTFHEIKELVKPNPISIEKVQDWLSSNGINNHHLTHSGDFIKAKVPIEKAEQLLSVKYYRITNKVYEDVSFYRSLDPYTVPVDIAPHIDFIGGVNHLPLMAPVKQTNPVSEKRVKSIIDQEQQSTQQNRLPLITPQILRRVHNVTNQLLETTSNNQKNVSPSTLKNSQAIAQFLGEYYSPVDLDLFQKRFDLKSQNVTMVLGPNHPNKPGMESSLDIEYIMAMAPNVDTWIMSLPGLNEGQEPFLDWLVNMSSMPDLPLVHSVSYGDEETSIERAYTKRVDVEFQKYALMGRTILFASGDSGTGCSSKCNQYVPGWPASSPYVTTVGGVYMNADNQIDGDTISGGGFSNYFEVPYYQSKEVNSYLDQFITNSSHFNFFNRVGRGYPDIASFSQNLVIYHNQKLLSIGGTSASTPIIAGLFSLINEDRIKNSEPPIGFVNPFIYQIAAQHPDAFMDISTGENKFGCCERGFQSKPGWDPHTGLGLPNMEKLVQYLKVKKN